MYSSLCLHIAPHVHKSLDFALCHQQAAACACAGHQTRRSSRHVE